MKFMEDDMPPLPQLSSEDPNRWTLADAQKLADHAFLLRGWELNKRLPIRSSDHPSPQEKSDSAKSDCPGSSSRYGDLNSHVAFYWRFISSTGRWERAFVEPIQSGDGAGI